MSCRSVILSAARALAAGLPRQETEIYGIPLRFDNLSAMAKSDSSYVKTHPDFAITLQFSKRKY